MTSFLDQDEGPTMFSRLDEATAQRLMHAKKKSVSSQYGPTLPAAKSALGLVNTVTAALASSSMKDNPSDSYMDASSASLVNLTAQKKKDTTRIRELLQQSSTSCTPQGQ